MFLINFVQWIEKFCLRLRAHSQNSIINFRVFFLFFLSFVFIQILMLVFYYFHPWGWFSWLCALVIFWRWFYVPSLIMLNHVYFFNQYSLFIDWVLNPDYFRSVLKYIMIVQIMLMLTHSALFSFLYDIIETVHY